MIDAAEENAQTDQPNVEQKLVETLQSLLDSNDALLRECNDVAEQVQWIEVGQWKAKQAALQQLSGAFSGEVLLVLKRNADQLEELKKQHIAEKENTKATAKKLMLWTSGQAVNSTEQDLQADAVKHGRFKWFQLPGSSLSSGALAGHNAGNISNSTARAMRFWQTGLPAGVSVPRTFSDTPWAGDQMQPQRSLTNLLFGKGRRSSGGGAAVSPSPDHGSRRVSEGSASWRSSSDGNGPSRRGSHRSSNGGHARNGSLAQPQPSAELVSGEGPLSKSHSMLAKPGTQQEVVVGRSLEIVAEDEREGHDSPQPAAGPRNSTRNSTTMHPALMATFNPAEQGHIVKLLAGPVRTISPIDTTSFSFGNKQDDEPHSPNLVLRGSVSSRPADSRCATARDPAAAAGPLTRSSMQLQASMIARVDPFDAPEPQPQPFVEQMKLEDQAMKAGQAAQQAAAPGFIGALRRSMGGALKLGSMAVAGVAAGPAGLAAAAVSPGALGKRSQSRTATLLHPSEPGPLKASAGHMLLHSMHQQSPTAEGDVTFLDLDATAAYTKGINGIIATLQQNVQSDNTRNASETHSQTQTPRATSGQQDVPGIGVAAATGSAEDAAAEAAAQAAAVMTAPAALARAMSPSRPPVHDEIIPANEEAEQQQQRLTNNSVQDHVVDRLSVQQLEQQHKLPLPSVSLSPEASGQMPALPPYPASSGQGGQPGTPFSTMGQSFRPSNSSGVSSRRQSQGLPSVGPVTRGLPVMGQASMDILGRPSISSTSSRQLVSSSSMNLRLTDVYSQTTGNPSPLAAGLSSIRRVSSSSQGSRSMPPRLRTSPRALVGDTSSVPTPSIGPLAKQYSSTMQSAKKLAQNAGLAAVSPRDGTGRKSPWGWQALGLPTGPGAPLADQTIDPATYPQGNKYAASWGLVDAATAAAATPGLSRQNSAVTGALSRQQSQAAVQGQLSRQNSTMSQRHSPRYTADQTPGQQQQRRASNTGAAGRYANPSSVTPTEDSPRSERVTPRRVSDIGTAQQQGGGGRTLESRRISDVGSEDSAYYEVESGSRASSFSGYASSNGQGGGTSARGGWQQQQQQRSGAKVGGAKGASPIPHPPAFLSGRPTSAQAAVAAAWSPNKHASAIAQAPAGWRAYGLSPESSGMNYGLSPHGLTDTPSQPANHSRGGPFQQQQQTAYAGGYTVHGGTMSSAPSQDIYAPAKELVATELGQQQRTQQQRVTTAVDMARARSFRRTSSSTGGGYSHGGAQQQGPGHIVGGNGSRGLGGPAVAGSKGAAPQRQDSARNGSSWL